MKIVVLDGYLENPGDISWAPLEALGELTVYDRLPTRGNKETIERIGDAEIAVSNKTIIDREVLDACKNLRLITVLATGYNVVDVNAAKEKGIPVCNVPAYGTAFVAQHTLALLLEICHHVAHHSDSVYSGRWEQSIDWCYWDYPLLELAGKTVGIIGFGRIGMQFARLCRALDMQVLAYSRSERVGGRELAKYVDLDTLLSQSDVVSLHCPLFPETAGIINAAALSKMKDGAILINTARGGLIDSGSVAEALRSGKLSGCGVDVLSPEPPEADDPLLTAPNCMITPHIAFTPVEIRQRVVDICGENLESFLNGGRLNRID